MTCIRLGNSAIVCINPWGRLKVGSRYVWVDFHPWCGPAFFTDANMTKVYEPADEDDPVWPEFTKWLDKHNAAKAKQEAAREAQSPTASCLR